MAFLIVPCPSRSRDSWLGDGNAQNLVVGDLSGCLSLRKGLLYCKDRCSMNPPLSSKHHAYLAFSCLASHYAFLVSLTEANVKSKSRGFYITNTTTSCTAMSTFDVEVRVARESGFMIVASRHYSYNPFPPSLSIRPPNHISLSGRFAVRHIGVSVGWVYFASSWHF